MQNQIKFPTDEQLPPDGCGIIIEFYDTESPEAQPGPDASNAADFVDARIKTVTFVRDMGELHQPQMIEFRFNEKGEIHVRETQGGFIDVVIPDRVRGDVFNLVQSFKIT